MVYYRKYRPQTISELDLGDVREKLTAILKAKEIPHAFLFTGSKGLGKTSSARILAKAINCINKNQESRVMNHGKKTNNDKDHNSLLITHDSLSIEPCNKCFACMSITEGSNIDVLEIDAASNGGVEEIRSLREKVKFSPSSLRRKVYIIDEVHMLSIGAFNALLKTLEEPPSHAIFILATTELHKLPPTIISRTFQIQFEKPTLEQMVRSLSRIIKGEKLSVSNDVLTKLAEISDGAFRDAAKNLEELVLACNGKEMTLELFDQVFRTKGLNDEVFDLLKAYEKRDPKKALELISKMSENGMDFKIVLERLVEHLRGILMLQNGIKSLEMDVVGLTLEDIHSLLGYANEAYGELKISIIPQLPLELMSVKFCVLDSRPKTDSKEQVSINEPLITTSGSLMGKHSFSISEELNPKPSTLNPPNLLPQLITKVNELNKPGGALLRSVKTAILENDVLIITTPFPIHAERLRSEKVLPDIQKAVESVVGKKVEVKIQVLTLKN